MQKYLHKKTHKAITMFNKHRGLKKDQEVI